MGISKTQDATRAERKAKKRNAENAIPDLPGDSGITTTEDISNTENENTSKKRKRGASESIGTSEQVEDDSVRHKREKGEKREKKRAKALQDATITDLAAEDQQTDNPALSKRTKKAKASSDSKDQVNSISEESNENLVANPAIEVEEPRKSKKERKAEKKAREALRANESGPTESNEVLEVINLSPINEESLAEVKKPKKNNRNREKKRKNASDGPGGVNGEKKDQHAEKASAPPRFIVFIGNLPFSATKQSIQEHFVAVKPKDVRPLSKREDPTKSKGCAFVEFEGYDHMKTCLKSYHHSTFDDGISPPRKITVELTAGGGGKTQNRQTKIKEKNQKLTEQRIRRIQEEEKTKSGKKDIAIDHNDVHPSRRTRVPDAI